MMCMVYGRVVCGVKLINTVSIVINTRDRSEVYNPEPTGPRRTYYYGNGWYIHRQQGTVYATRLRRYHTKIQQCAISNTQSEIQSLSKL